MRTLGSNATSITARLAAGLKGMNAVMTAVNFSSPGLSVSVEQVGPRMSVTVNGFALYAGRTRMVGASTVQRRAFVAGTPNEVTVQQPGMQVQVRQPWIGRQAPWLDVAIRLTKAPTSPSGVLGGTFPQLSRLAKTSG